MNVRNIAFLILLLFYYVANAQKVDFQNFEGIKARSIGPAGMSGRVTSIDVVLKDTDIIYVGTASGGLWCSESGGINWEPIFDKESVLSIGAVAVNQQNPDIIWVGTGEGNPRNSQSSGYGVYRSIDGGKNWELMGLENSRNIHRIVLDPNDHNTVYVGAQGTAWGDSEFRGVYKTTDGGRTWRKILYTNQSTGISDMVMDPNNPGKLIVSMWEFRRWPWFFKSGGKGSAIHITWDGGENWRKITEEDGLPKGELGRIGLAIAPSNTKIIYALIEAEKNALYKSEDGGFKWKKVSDKNIGNRPFYYADIYVDPKNENRLYNLYSFVSVSEDGGKTFSPLLPWTYKPTDIHPDHHAWWVHPDNPNYLIEGNDGGLNISLDRGKNWRFIGNIPVAQFYHINYDMEIPYNVYGGMQDNGSWRGPAYVWRSGGIRNEYWDEIDFGDGFDVVPDPVNSEYAYTMAQGGFLNHTNLKTGKKTIIRPIHPDGIDLRFNWNAGISVDHFDKNVIYYGSQFLHKTTSQGNDWEIISPDLTTNDPEKQKQAESGGLTIDVTAAENHTAILSIAPSPVQNGVIWVGTDDGNLQLTQDAGTTWTKLNDRIKNLPQSCWIPQIHPSTFAAGEAFVVVNNYRQNDWNPYLYHTSDFGKSWQNLVAGKGISGHVLSIEQDTKEENLLFLGAENGLYISFDKGETWNKWNSGFPSAAAIDLKIHPRENDLIIGTFGRAAYILDDIAPFREIARSKSKVLEQKLKIFDAPDGYLAASMQAAGSRFAGNAIFIGQNRPAGVRLTCWINELNASKDGEVPKSDTIFVRISDPDLQPILSYKVGIKKGMNRFTWNMRSKSERMPLSAEPKDKYSDRSQFAVPEGTYWVKISYGEEKDSVQVKVNLDPRADYTQKDLDLKNSAINAFNEMVKNTTTITDRLQKSEKDLSIIKKILINKKLDSLSKQATAVNDSIKSLYAMVKVPKDTKGIVDDSEKLNNKLGRISYYLATLTKAPSNQHNSLMQQYKKALEEFESKVDDFYESQYIPFIITIESEVNDFYKTE